MKNIVLETHDLRKEFGDVVAVGGISFPVYEGEVFGFLGPNGSGKTTTISMALGVTTENSDLESVFLGLTS